MKPQLDSVDGGLNDDIRFARPHIAAVAFCTDKNMEAPLHVAASTLLRHLSADYTAHFYLLLSGFSPDNIDCLRRTLDKTSRAYSITLLEANSFKAFARLSPLLGSRVPYYRLLLPDLVNEERLLYLDSDLQVNVDVSPLFKLDLGTKPAGFVVSGTVKFSLDHKLLTSIGRLPDAPAFNSGVCLFNIGEWHRQKCWERLLSFAEEHKTELKTADQSLLNSLFGDDCHPLERKFNVAIYPSPGQVVPETGIIHFVGSPKPWDIGARWMFPHAERWFDDLRETAVPRIKRVTWLNGRSWARLPKVIPGYIRHLRAKLRS